MQAFGMMGWRLGYIAYPNASLAADPDLGFQMSKVQDTIPICVSQMSQVAGLGALQAGSPWVRQQVQGLAGNRWGCSLQPLFVRTAPASNQHLAAHNLTTSRKTMLRACWLSDSTAAEARHQQNSSGSCGVNACCTAVENSITHTA